MKITKYNIIAAFLLVSSSVMSQITEIDGLKFVQTDINGTARYMSMAGAFGALGGNVSAIKDNPAALGIYRRSEVTTTLNFTARNSRSEWAGIKAKDNAYRIKFDNFSYVIAAPTWNQINQRGKGLLFSNFSFSYNHLKNFNRNLIAKSPDATSSMSEYMALLVNPAIESNTVNYLNENISWFSVLGYDAYLVNKPSGAWISDLAGEQTNSTYRLRESGSINEYALAWSGNFSNRFYLGAAFNMLSISYQLASDYTENFLERDKGYFSLKNNYSTSGFGVNLRLGFMYQPFDYLRLGASIQTPTRFAISETYEPSIYYSYKNKTEKKEISGSNTPLNDKKQKIHGDSRHQIQSPLQVNAGIAYFFGKKGTFSAEYVFNNFENTRFYSEGGKINPSDREANQNMHNVLNNGHLVKLGAEYRITPEFSLRGGYAYASPATQNNAEKKMFENTIRTDPEAFFHRNSEYFSAGVGYRGRNWYIDFAWMHKVNNENFIPYHIIKAEPAKISIRDNNFVSTFGFRF